MEMIVYEDRKGGIDSVTTSSMRNDDPSFCEEKQGVNNKLVAVSAIMWPASSRQLQRRC